MTKERLENLLISAFEDAVNESEDATVNLIRATGITSSELEEIGYEKSNFVWMHDVAECNI